MSMKKVAAKAVALKPVTDVPRWVGSNLAEVFKGGGETRMACGIHEIFESETVEENPAVDDLLYVLEGEIDIRVKDKREVFRTGDFAYLFAGLKRTYIVRDRVKLIYVTYPSSWA